MKINIYSTISGVRHLGKQILFVMACSLLWVSASSQTTYTFNYTGNTQTITLAAGNYSIACWGANGGSVSANTATHGMGGYSSGNITLSSTTTFTVYVGGKGSGGAQPLGGFNSGNSTTKTNVTTATGGGGASDVRVLVDNFNNRIIVAGGGGGQGTSSGTGGHGGGLTGQNGQGTTNWGIAGSQTAPGLYPPGGDAKPATFGEGGDGPSGTTGGQGGGGWYGGSFGTRTNGGGAGGSGYVLCAGSFSPVGYFAANTNYYFTSTVTAMPGTTGFVNNPDVSGNGRVHITELCNITLSTSASGTANAAICTGQSLTLTTNATSSYSWSTGATTSSLVVSPTTNTVYSLSAMSPSNCIASKSISVTVSAGLPSVSVIASSLQICPSQSVILSATGAVTYTWSGGVVNGVAFTPSATTLYSVNGTNGCGTTTAGITITVSPLPVSVVSSNSTVCGNATATLVATANATLYTWQPNIPSTTSIAIVSPTVNTVYTITASDGTCSGTSTVSILSNPIPTIISSPTLSAICPGESATLTASGGISYTWSTGSSTLSTILVSPVTSTLYSVSGANSFGCQSSSNFIVLVGQQPTMSVASSSNLVCSGESVTLSVAGADSYAWTGGPGTSSYVVNPTQSGTYLVTGTLNSSGCTNTVSINIDVFLPVMSISGNTAICSGASATLSANAPGAGNTYVWNPGTIPLPSIVVTPASNFVYSVSALSSSNTVNCPVAGTVMVTVNPNPTLSVTAPTLMCIKETREMNASGATSYTWTLSGSTISTAPNATISSGTAASLNYSLTGMNNFGCSSSKLVLVVVNSCTGLNDASLLNASLTVYPNPSQGNFRLRSILPVQLTIVDETGRLIQVLNLNEGNGYSADISGLANGVYVIHSTNPQQKIAYKIVVID